MKSTLLQLLSSKCCKIFMNDLFVEHGGCFCMFLIFSTDNVVDYPQDNKLSHKMDEEERLLLSVTLVLSTIALLGIFLVAAAQKMIIYANGFQESGVNLFAIFCIHEIIAVIIIPLYLTSNWLTEERTRELISCNVVTPLLVVCLHLLTVFKVMWYLHMYSGVRFSFRYEESTIKMSLKYFMSSAVMCTIIIDFIPFLVNHSDSNNCLYQPMQWWFILTEVLFAFLPLPLLSVFSIYLVKVAAKHTIKGEKLRKQLAPSASASNIQIATSSSKKGFCRYCYLLQLKAFQTSFWTILCHLVFLQPVLILVFIYDVKGKRTNEITEVTLDNVTPCIILGILYLSLVLGPLIYFFRKKLGIRKILKILLSFSKEDIRILAKPKRKSQCSCDCRDQKIDSTSEMIKPGRMISAQSLDVSLPDLNSETNDVFIT